MEADDGRRPHVGVVVTLLDLGDGTSRLIMDDVTSPDLKRDTSWEHDTFYTHKRVNSKELDEMALPAQKYQEVGENLILRLLALNGRLK